MPIGPHKFEFDVVKGWEQLPEGWSFVEVAGVAVDSKDRVYVFNRGEHPVIVFDKDGKKLGNIPINEPWTANITFGGPDLKTLFITATHSVFSLDMAVSGYR